MTKQRDGELERPDTWDYERSEVRQPVRASRAVVSVAFRRDEFTLVSEYAEQVGKRTSAFIREAALEKVRGRETSSVAYITGGTAILWARDSLPTVTWVHVSKVEYAEESPATTY